MFHKVTKSEAEYKITVEKVWAKSQSSYNVPDDGDGDFWKFATSEDNKILKLDDNLSKEICQKRNVEEGKEEVYSLSSEYSFELGRNIIWLIGDEYKNKENKFIASRRLHKSGKWGKPQMFNGTYKHMGEEYEWFKELYEKNFLGSKLNFEIDGNVFRLDVEFDSLLDYPEYSEEKAFNRIIFGAPGTGKSHTLNEEKNPLLKENNSKYYERVTFHPDYSYAQFVGTYKPVPYNPNHDDEEQEKSNEELEKIIYKYVPGPFMKILVKALKNTKQKEKRNFLLIIEEINRANVAAVFGDVFQLLDRDENGKSQFPIHASEDMKKYLLDEFKNNDKFKDQDFESIYIPENLYIWATMNSADQGVYMMDSAFKRRWDFSYIDINNKEDKINDKIVCLSDDCEFNWNSLRKAINHQLLNQGINEDRLLGTFFIPLRNMDNDEKFIEIFKNKVLMYLFEDVGKHKRDYIFNKNLKTQNYFTYSKIYSQFETYGIKIFHEDIIKKYDELEELRNSV